MRKRLLIYAHYYVPDVASTGQLLRELAEGLIDKFEITVICVVPSYTGIIDEKYKQKKYYEEELNGVKLFRVRVPEFSKTNKHSRIKNIMSYFLGAMSLTTKAGAQDYVYTISQPPILGGLLGVWGKWQKRAKLIYNIQDFNPEQTIAVGYSKNKMILKLMSMLDNFSCKQADKVIVVGRDMVETLKKRFNYKKIPDYAFINNWIDENEIYPLDSNHEQVKGFKKQYGIDGKFNIMYSGNIGLYYDLENIVKVIGKFPQGVKTSDGREVVFTFVGAGSILDKLIIYKREHELDNVVFIPYQDKENLIYSLNAADVHWCINAKGIKGVSVPSKCYGIMAAGKPILGVLENGSECSMIINETKCGICCEPGDYEKIESQIKWFIDNAADNELEKMGSRGREYLVRNLTKEVSLKRYADEISSC